MAKATQGRAAPARVKSAPPKAAAGKKTTKAAVVPAKKSPAPKMAPVSPKRAGLAKAPVPKAAVGKGKAGVPPAKKAAAMKVASKSAAKTVPVKKVAARRAAPRSAVPPAAARRGRPQPVARKAPARAVRGVAPSVFTVSHLNEADFKADGLRAYAQYRDLGIAAATGGMCQAHVIRLVPPCTDEVRKRHLHKADLQLVYVLKGWMKNEFEGHGEQMMSVGSCWLQPSGIKHTVLDYSADCEVLEIIVPADFKTEELG